MVQNKNNHPASINAHSGQAMKKLKVLAVDDDPRYLELLEFTLAGEGFEVRTAQDSLMVQEIAAVSQPDVILSDIAMPNLDGYELAIGLKGDTRTAHIPLIFLTAQAEKSGGDSGRGPGGADYLTKPFSIGDLVTTIRRAAGQLEHEGRI